MIEVEGLTQLDASLASRRPAALSGGEQQRVGAPVRSPPPRA